MSENGKNRNSKNNEPISRCEQKRSKIAGKVLVNVDYENNKQERSYGSFDQYDLYRNLVADYLLVYVNKNYRYETVTSF